MYECYEGRTSFHVERTDVVLACQKGSTMEEVFDWFLLRTLVSFFDSFSCDAHTLRSVSFLVLASFPRNHMKHDFSSKRPKMLKIR